MSAATTTSERDDTAFTDALDPELFLPVWRYWRQCWPTPTRLS
jgi:hypothetical protein